MLFRRSVAGNLSKAEEQAYHLLLQHLTPEQTKTFQEQGYFEFFYSRTGAKWRCYTEEALKARGSPYLNAKLVRWNKIGTYVSAYNVWASPRYRTTYGYALPECDTLLALKAAVEATGRIPTGCESPHLFAQLEKALKPGELTKYPS